MVVSPGTLEAALAAVVGDEPALIAELRQAFFASANTHTSNLAAAKSPEEWRAAANRLHSLAASFGALRLVNVAIEALRISEDDGTMVRKIKRTISALDL